jgi:hypothetical protein
MKICRFEIKQLPDRITSLNKLSSINLTDGIRFSEGFLVICTYRRVALVVHLFHCSVAFSCLLYLKFPFLCLPLSLSSLDTVTLSLYS